MSGGDRVLVTCPQMQGCMDEFADRFSALGIEISQPEVVQQPSEEELCRIIGDFDGMIAGDDPLSRRVLDHAGRMRIISKWGVGTDGIDTAAAAELGIAVTNTPDVFGEAVADLAMGYVLILARQLHRIDAAVRTGGWLKVEGQTLAGRTIGIVGLGSIGRSLARRAGAFGMTMLAHDIAESAQQAAEELGADNVSLDDLLARSDYVVLCCPLTAATRHLIDSPRIALMKDGARVVNVSRGPIVDETALAAALRSGKLAGAGLDVFEREPLPADSPLRECASCVFGSHNGSNTTEAVRRASRIAVENLLDGLQDDR